MKTNVDLLKGNIWKGMILFAVPVFISNIFQQLYNTIDTMIVGNFLGEKSLAAIGASSSVYEMLVGFALGIGSGMSIVVARNYGSGNKERMKRSVAGTIIIGVIVSVLIMLLASFFLRPLLVLLNTPADILEEAYSYVITIVLGVSVMFAYNLSAGLLRAVGNSLIPLYFLMIASAVNMVLDLVFVLGLDMGIQGAAAATIIAKAVSAILSILYIWKKCPMLIPEKRHFRIQGEIYRDLLSQGLSMAFMSSLVSAGSVILQSSINGLGYLTIAGHTAARRVYSFCVMPVTAVALSISTFVSQNKGADQGERIRKAVCYANLLAVGWSLVLTVLLNFGAGFMVGLISGSDQSIVLENGARYLSISAPFYALLGILLNTRYALQGLGVKILPLLSSVVELGGKAIFSFRVIPTLGYLGVILCEPAIWCVMGLFLLYSFYNNDYIKCFARNSAKERRDGHNQAV